MTEAEEAAAQWGGRPLRLIGQRENAVYELLLGNGARAALRLHRVAYQREDAIAAELRWCAGLAAQGLPVPPPVPTPDGALTVRLSTGRLASVTAWIAGEALGATSTPLAGPVDRHVALHRALGALLAAVHDATDAAPPDPFPRPRWDVEGLVGEAPLWGRFWDHPAASAADAANLRAVRTLLRTRLTALRNEGADTGPIHADVLRENVLVNGPSLSLIDFDDCGTGFRPYDLGTALLANWQEPARDALRDALIAGYATRRPVDPATVDLMTLARACASVGWTIPRLAPDDPIHKSHIARAIRLARPILG